MVTARSDSYAATSGGGVFAGIADLPSWRAGLTNGVWKELSGTAPSSHTTAVGGAVSANIMDAYSGIHVAGNDDDLVIWGGRHNNYSGNEVLGLLLWADTPAIRTICEPTAVGDRGTGVVWWGTAPNQKPAVPHTYDSGVYSAALGRHIWIGQSSPGGEPSGSSGALSGGDRMFSMVASTGVWVQLADDLGAIPSGSGKSVARDTTGHIYTLAQDRCHKYTVGSGWAELVFSGDLHTSGLTALTYDSLRDRLLRLSCDEIRFLTIDCTAGTVVDRTASLSGSGSVVADLTALVGLDSPGVCYDPDNDRFIVPNGTAGQFYAINASTWAVTLVNPSTASGTVPDKAVGSSSGIFGRVKYVPRLKGVAYYPAGSSNCWFLPTATL